MNGNKSYENQWREWSPFKQRIPRLRRVHKQLASSRYLEIRLGTSVVGILSHPKAEAAYSEAIALPVGTLASQFGLGVQANPNDRATAGQHAGGVTTTLRSWIGLSRFLCLLFTPGAAQSILRLRAGLSYMEPVRPSSLLVPSIAEAPTGRKACELSSSTRRSASGVLWASCWDG